MLEFKLCAYIDSDFRLSGYNIGTCLVLDDVESNGHQRGNLFSLYHMLMQDML